MKTKTSLTRRVSTDSSCMTPQLSTQRADKYSGCMVNAPKTHLCRFQVCCIAKLGYRKGNIRTIHECFLIRLMKSYSKSAELEAIQLSLIIILRSQEREDDGNSATLIQIRPKLEPSSSQDHLLPHVQINMNEMDEQSPPLFGIGEIIPYTDWISVIIQPLDEHCTFTTFHALTFHALVFRQKNISITNE
jgi:hypothetical protein